MKLYIKFILLNCFFHKSKNIEFIQKNQSIGMNKKSIKSDNIIKFTEYKYIIQKIYTFFSCEFVIINVLIIIYYGLHSDIL